MEYEYLFIFGPPRAGTTALQGNVCAAIGSNFSPESNYLTDLFELYARVTDYPDPVRFPYFFGDDGSALAVYRQCALSMMAHLASREPSAITVLKDPMMSAVATSARRLLGDRPKFLGIVRHPADVMASLKRVRARSGGAWEMESDILSVFRCYQGIHELDGINEANNLVVRYEDVIAYRKKTVEKLGKFIGAEFGQCSKQPDWLLKNHDDYSSPGYGMPIGKIYAGDGHTFLTESELNQIQVDFSGIMTLWGYEPRVYQPSGDEI